jgi:hypothetical protein
VGKRMEQREGGRGVAYLVLWSRSGRLVFLGRVRSGRRRRLFGKTRCERDGCDVSAIETRQQVFTPSEGGLRRLLSAMCQETGEKKRACVPLEER